MRGIKWPRKHHLKVSLWELLFFLTNVVILLIAGIGSMYTAAHIEDKPIVAERLEDVEDEALVVAIKEDEKRQLVV